MLSKSKGQTLRIAAILHVLFNWEQPTDIPKEISTDALKAAVNFIDVCIQHSAFLAGRGDINEAISKLRHIQSCMQLNFRFLCTGCVMYNLYVHCSSNGPLWSR